MKIRLVIANQWPDGDFDCDDDTKDENYLIEKYVSENVDNVDKLKEVGFVVDDFIVPDDLDHRLILNICNGRSFEEWVDYPVEFYNDYYQDWIFVDDGGKYKHYKLFVEENQ